MAGETAKYTPFSKTNNVCVIFHAKDGSMPMSMRRQEGLQG